MSPGCNLVNGIDPGVSKTQPLATFSHRSAVIALRKNVQTAVACGVGGKLKLELKTTYSRLMIALAQALALRTALSMVAGRPVAVQSPAM